MISKIVIGIIVLFVVVSIYLVFKPSSSNIESQTNPNTGLAEKCLVEILGGKYDVTEFRNIHPGGNIYRCGEDMTNDFLGQHGNDLDRIAPYKVQ